MATILVVDDDPSIRHVISSVLQMEGYTVLEAANGQRAIEIAQQWLPSVILMDLMMPVLDGIEAMHVLKEDAMTRWIQIIAMSAGVNLRRQTGRLIPSDALMAKPFDLDELLAQVELGLERVRQVANDIDGTPLEENQ